jgi:hypothetical protein
MQPNDLPLVCIPLDLSDESAASLITFLYELTECLERHYAGQLINRYHQNNPSSPPAPSAPSNPNDPPF